MSVEAKLGWRFARRSGSDVEHDPTEADQFNSEDVNLKESLVREATQNSQDAWDGSADAVEVRLARVQGAELDGELLGELTAGLPTRLEASGLTYQPPADRSVLVVEDFGTKGLTGNWSDDQDKEPFRSFWFRHGRSFKQGTNGGRWGLGKLVFPMSSSLRCHFGLTIRDSSEGGLLLGQAVLKTHNLESAKYAPHGHWGRLVDDEVEPVADPAFLRRFATGFGLKRGDRPGLSIVVPEPRETREREALVRFVADNYAFPVLTGRLVFDVLGEGVDAASLRDREREWLAPGLIDFIDEVKASGSSVIELTQARMEAGSYKVREEDFDPEVLDRMRRRFADRKLVSVRLPLALTRRDGSRGASYADVHLKATAADSEPQEKGVALCVRGDITVPGVARRFQADSHFALLEAKHPLVSEFLGDAENPAHTDWNAGAERFRANWRDYAPHKLRLIRGAVSQVHRIVGSGGRQKDQDALQDIFWIDDPNPGKGGAAKARTGRRGAIVVKPSPNLPPVERVLNISKIAGGFAVTPASGFAKRELPARLGIRVAYDLAHGDPFKEWRPFDFDFGSDDIELELEGAKHAAKGCRIELRVEEPAFRLKASGFDPKRDLVLKWGWLKETGDA